MQMTLRQIRYFVAIAEAGKMSLAGQMLGVSQSVITDALQALEAEAGTRLVTRHGRGVSLTHDGYRFLIHARRIMAAVADATQIFAPRSRPSGTVRLGVVATVAGYFLAPFLARFQRSHPDIKVAVTELDRCDIEEKLASGELDLAILLASTLRRRRELERKILFASPRRLWVSPGHRLAAQRRVRLREVAQENYLLLTNDDNERTTLGYWREHKLMPNVGFRSVSIEAVRNLVAAGAGVTILSDMVYRPFSLEGEPIVARQIADPVPNLELALVWKKRAALDGCCATFRDAANGYVLPERERADRKTVASAR